MVNRFNLFFQLSVFLFISLFFAQTALAVGIGFVPASRLWFSDISFPPRESTWIYTVIINNSYYKLDAKIGFYVNDQLVDTADIRQLPNLEAIQVRGLWHPTVGNFKVGVQFISATGIDETGKRTAIDVGEINTIDNTAISIGPPADQSLGTQSTSSQTNTNLPASSENSPASLSPSLSVAVTKENNQLVIAPLSNQIIVPSSPTDDLKKKFEKNVEEAEQKITGMANVVTSTLKNVSSFVNDGKEVVEKGKTIFNKGSEKWQAVSGLRNTFLSWWDRLSHHNDPIQIIKIILLFAVFRWIAKFLIRRRRRNLQ